jgi:hypothetical protein
MYCEMFERESVEDFEVDPPGGVVGPAIVLAHGFLFERG